MTFQRPVLNARNRLVDGKPIEHDPHTIRVTRHSKFADGEPIGRPIRLFGQRLHDPDPTPGGSQGRSSRTGRSALYKNDPGESARERLQGELELDRSSELFESEAVGDSRYKDTAQCER